MLILDYAIKATPSVFKYFHFPTQRNQNNLLHLNLHSSTICQLNKTIDIIYMFTKWERETDCLLCLHSTAQNYQQSNQIKSPNYIYNFHIDWLIIREWLRERERERAASVSRSDANGGVKDTSVCSWSELNLFPFSALLAAQQDTPRPLCSGAFHFLHSSYKAKDPRGIRCGMATAKREYSVLWR